MPISTRCPATRSSIGAGGGPTCVLRTGMTARRARKSALGRPWEMQS